MIEPRNSPCGSTNGDTVTLTGVFTFAASALLARRLAFAHEAEQPRLAFEYLF
jgi:hypothetical protein